MRHGVARLGRSRKTNVVGVAPARPACTSPTGSGRPRARARRAWAGPGAYKVRSGVVRTKAMRSPAGRPGGAVVVARVGGDAHRRALVDAADDRGRARLLEFEPLRIDQLLAVGRDRRVGLHPGLGGQRDDSRLSGPGHRSRQQEERKRRCDRQYCRRRERQDPSSSEGRSRRRRRGRDRPASAGRIGLGVGLKAVANGGDGIQADARIGGERLAQPGHAAVQRALGDNPAVPADVDQLVAADGMSAAAVQRHQHLHHLRLQGGQLAVGLHLQRRRPHLRAGQAERPLPRQVSFGQSTTLSFIAKPSRINHARGHAVPGAPSHKSPGLNSSIRRDYKRCHVLRVSLSRGCSPPDPPRRRTAPSRSAADAFGERVGTEQSGLYNESQVRGFDLNDSGAYRIDDAYFSRAASAERPGAGRRGRARRRERRAPRLPCALGRRELSVARGRAGERAAPGRGLSRLRHARGSGRRLVCSAGSAQPRRRFRVAPPVALAHGLAKGTRSISASSASWNVAPGHRLRAFGSVYQAPL